MDRRKIRAIETRYSGCRFRSRLEARWCVLFNRMEWNWEYEPQGFALPGGNYLPDFRLDTGSGREPFWFEIKPGNQVRDDARWAELAEASGLVVIVARGMHRTGDDCTSAHGAVGHSPGGVTARLDLLWQRRVPESIWDAASSARFEFGETG